MTEFILHTMRTAPAASRNFLQDVEKKMGFIPNLISVMAESPATLESYLSLGKFFDKTSFTTTERQLVLLTISRFRNCCYCLAAHGSIAKMQNIPTEIVNAVYYNQKIQDEQLDALQIFTREVLDQQGWITQESLKKFYQAGYSQQHVLEVILAISFKTISNFMALLKNEWVNYNLLNLNAIKINFS